MDDQPLISVVMSMYNAAPFVREAVESILVQSLGNFEFIIVDDCSTDDSAAIVRSIADPRIRVLQGTHTGLHSALNLAIAQARAPLIARMDADDLSEPDRLAIQYRFLQAHPGIAMAGTWYRTFGEGGCEEVRLPVEDPAIKYHLYSRSPFAHGTVMLRRDILASSGLFRFARGEDYDLWLRISERAEVANIPIVLYRYRVSEGQVSSVYAGEVTATARLGRRTALQRYLFGIDSYGCRRPTVETRSLLLMMQFWAQAALKKGNPHLSMKLLHAALRLGVVPAMRGFEACAVDTLRRAVRYGTTGDSAYLHFGASFDQLRHDLLREEQALGTLA